jgi:hypothetical protein
LFEIKGKGSSNIHKKTVMVKDIFFAEKFFVLVVKYLIIIYSIKLRNEKFREFVNVLLALLLMFGEGFDDCKKINL